MNAKFTKSNDINVREGGVITKANGHSHEGTQGVYVLNQGDYQKLEKCIQVEKEPTALLKTAAQRHRLQVTSR